MEVLLCWVNCVLWFHCFACIMLAHTTAFAKLNHQIFRELSKRLKKSSNVSQFSLNRRSIYKVYVAYEKSRRQLKRVHPPNDAQQKSQFFKTITLERRHGTKSVYDAAVGFLIPPHRQLPLALCVHVSRLNEWIAINSHLTAAFFPRLCVWNVCKYVHTHVGETLSEFIKLKVRMCMCLAKKNGRADTTISSRDSLSCGICS